MRGKHWLIAGSLALATGIGAGTAGPAMAKDQDQNRNTPAIVTPDDISLAESVKATLAKDNLLPENIDAAATDGVVVLTGSVRNEDDRKRAIQDAKKVPGVMVVKDNMTIFENDF
jgi:osmotically-inducible protein OsmY